ncbi:MAG TPA: polysaccharide export protein Wza [Alcanivorax sp.]|nr:polysaccharide export protein Wza [Alcanivorax sp.]HBU65677.1 polysaccharide export protein Wza [Alcanivorax sp.]HCD75676.1 polysaccharide export protein Wza [Alcanivorax sp.]HCK28566.1 polysaccharide export protein Wza [Alcanivorax sp.]
MTAIMKTLAIFGLLLAVAGCTIVPGSDRDAEPGWFAEDEQPDAASLPDVIKTHTITTAILDQNEAPAPELPEALADSPESYDYEVGIGDVLQITVWDHPELTIPAGSMRSAQESGNLVHSDGNIFYPYVGKLHVEGMKVTEIREMITDRLDEYIEAPQVDVAVAGFRSKRIYVTGAVNKPGTYPITNVPMRLVDAVSAAGGIGENANWSQVILSRDGEEYRLSLRGIYENGNAAQNVLLRPGDVVNVSRSDDNKVFVLGEVVKPESIPMGRNGMSLAEALSNTGGLDEREADASGIFVFRKAQPGQEHGIDVYQLNAKDAAALVLADSFELQPRDIVYVTAAPLARWNRVLSLLVPSVTALYLGGRAESELGSD